MLTTRQKIAIALMIIGILLVFGAMGEADFSGIMAEEFFIRTGIGLFLMAISLPISGELSADFEGVEDDELFEDWDDE